MSIKPGKRLDGRVALVTGASRGIGFGIAAAFADQGAEIMISAITPAKLDEARGKIGCSSARVESAVADVSDRDACFELVKRTIAKYGKIDILVNCAGIYLPKPFLEYSSEDFAWLINVDLFGPFHLMQAVLPHMISARYGKIINIASTAGKWGSINQSAYNAAKHGLVGLTRCVALETARFGININAICPGMVETDLIDEYHSQHAAIGETTPEEIRKGLMNRIPLGRLLDPMECGHLAVYLASAESDGMTGQSILLDGGMLMV